MSLIAALVAVVIVAAVVYQAGRSSNSTHAATPNASSLLRGIRQNGFTLGALTAPAKLQVYAYVTTPGFGDFVNDDLPTLIRDYVREGKLEIELRTVASKINDSDVDAAQLLQAAGLRNQLWPTLFAFVDQYVGRWTDVEAKSVLKSAGVADSAEVLGLRTNRRVVAAIDRATEGARSIKLRAATAYRLTTASGVTRTIDPANVDAGVRSALGDANTA